MTLSLTVPAGEHGTVRLFAIDLPDEAARAFAADPDAIGRALGAEGLDPGHIDVFPVSRIAPLGLPVFLAEGHGIAPEDLEPHQAALDALDGHVAVVSSGAFRGAARTLDIAPPLRLVGAWREAGAPVVFGDLPAAGADPAASRPEVSSPGPQPPRSKRRTNGLVAFAVLIVAVLGFIVLNGAR